MVGANPVEAHPVVGARLLQRVLHGAKLVVADPRAVGLALHADVHLRPRPGTNVALFHGFAHVVLAEGLADEEFLRERAVGLPELTELLADYPPDRVADITGVPAADLVAAARLYGRARRPAILYGLGVTEHLHGTDGVRSLTNLAILRGAVGTDRGYGVNPLRGQNNVQGASDMGALPDFLPGYGRVSDPAARSRAEAVYLELDPVDFLDVHPDDAARYDVRDGAQVTVESRHGRACLIARVGEQTALGQVFCSFHFPASGVNRLTSDHADTVTSCPEYKVTAVRVASSS
ncbi:molybdopterin oxidoreductase family protein [Streptomyces sp. NPDC050564]|uniref:molybdopterin oxidoreductase family protein n=1 Tax=Streptomyces sp. NPDC050564 TaxID=3365631 RepID=UPI0037912AA1